MMEKENNSEGFINPIDRDKVTDSPGLLPYAHTVGGAVIRPEDKGKIKSRALSAMEQQTGRQLQQLQDQMAVLAKQARALQKRVEISHSIYMADVAFEPLVGHTYFLYRRPNGKEVLMMISPEEWGHSGNLEYVATVNLMADHTWDVLDWPESFNTKSDA